MAIELAAQSERLVLLNEVGCVDDVIQAAERLCVKLGNLIALQRIYREEQSSMTLKECMKEKETVHGA